MKIMIWELHNRKPYEPTVTYIALDLYLQAAKTI